MDNNDRIVLAIVIATVLLLAMVAFMGLLMVVNANRRQRHRAELAELQLNNNHMVMEAEREATQQTLRELGQELHDNVGQQLTMAQVSLHTLMTDPLSDPRLSVPCEALEQCIEEVRRLAHSLNSDLWRDRSLAEAIGQEAARLERVGRLRVHVWVRGTIPELPADTNTVLFRVFQEIINNALKHSGADTIEITLLGHPGFGLTVADNGRGFDPGQKRANGGLHNIRRRCDLIRFMAHCSTAPGKGCIWHLQPLAAHGA